MHASTALVCNDRFQGQSCTAAWINDLCNLVLESSVRSSGSDIVDAAQVWQPNYRETDYYVITYLSSVTCKKFRSACADMSSTTTKPAKSRLGAPSQLSQSSRKGKRAWRKNIDIQPVEQGLESLRAEERVVG